MTKKQQELLGAMASKTGNAKTEAAAACAAAADGANKLCSVGACLSEIESLLHFAMGAQDPAHKAHYISQINMMLGRAIGTLDSAKSAAAYAAGSFNAIEEDMQPLAAILNGIEEEAKKA